MKYFKIIISLFIILAMVFSLSFSCFAANSTVTSRWDYMLQNIVASTDATQLLGFSVHDIVGHLVGNLSSDLGGNLCGVSSDQLHHGHIFTGDKGTDDHGSYAICTCDQCGKPFKYYQSDYNADYSSHVGSLPGGGFGRSVSKDSNTFLLPIKITSWDTLSSSYQSYGCTFINNSSQTNFDFTFSSYNGWMPRFCYSPITAPCNCRYSWYNGLILSKCSSEADTQVKYYSSGTASSGLILTQSLGYCYFNANNVGVICTVKGVLGYWITPIDTSYINNNFPVSSRVNNIVNNFAYQTTENNYTYVNNTPLFDENTLVFTNPITGLQVNINDWWYDYITRTYTLNYTDNGTLKTSTINYGDTNIIVTDSGNTYNYYYTVPSCNHNYVLTSQLDATCTGTGSRTYTCTKCNDSYTETVPALGHDWIKGATVATTYEADGTTVKEQGYTLYTCSRCGEEYHDTTGAGPPSTSSNTVSDLNWLQRIYYKLTEILKAVLGIDSKINVDTASDTDIKIPVPGPDGEENKTWSLNDMKAKFGWVHEIHTIMTTFVSDVTGDSESAYAMAAVADSGSSTASLAAVDISSSNSSAPSIQIDFSKAQSAYGYNYGGQSEVLDLSWYAQYKPTVDALLSGFLWMLFLWGVFKHAPSIITGGDIVENQVDDIKKGHKA